MIQSFQPFWDMMCCSKAGLLTALGMWAVAVTGDASNADEAGEQV
jgi:hypothetical protein